MPSYLVVDDSATIRMTIVGALRSLQTGGRVEVVEAATERDAIDHFMGGSFDLVFLDMMLGGAKNALDVLRAILAAKPDAKVIVTTGLDREHPDVVEAISMGAFGFVRKPVRVSDLRNVLEEVAAESGHAGRIR